MLHFLSRKQASFMTTWQALGLKNTMIAYASTTIARETAAGECMLTFYPNMHLFLQAP